MGNWVIAYHWWADGAAPRPKRPDDDRWAMRSGPIAPGLSQLETLEKWGYQSLVAPDVIGACAAYDYLSGGPVGDFFAGWNYVLSPAGADAALFAEAAGLIPGAAARADGDRRLLCLPAPVALAPGFVRIELSCTLTDDRPAARVVEALALERSLRQRRTVFVLGLHTRAHGYVHTGELTLSLGRNDWDSWARLRATGEYNPNPARWTGPYGTSIYVTTDAAPARRPAVPWPCAGPALSSAP